MRKFTRTLSCTLIAALLLTVAATAAACGKKAEYPTVSEVTGSQAAGEVIPAVDRQERGRGDILHLPECHAGPHHRGRLYEGQRQSPDRRDRDAEHHWLREITP